MAEATGQILDEILVDEIGNEELVFTQHLLKQGQLAGNVTRYHIVQHKLKPLTDVHLEEVVVSDQLTVDVV
jgi:hypothetical protein